MTLKLTLPISAQAEFSGLVITPALASETITPQSAGKDVGDVRLVNGHVLLSLGPQKKLSLETLRQAGGLLARWLAKNNASEAGLELGPLFGLGLPPVSAVYALLEGLLLGAFSFAAYKSEREEKQSVLRLLISGETGPSREELERVIRKAEVVAEAVNLARAWSHEPPNVLNPVTLAERVQNLAAEVGLKCTVLDDAQLTALGAGAMTAVGKGSNTPARLILLEHPGSTGGAPVALVGKALTMDTGGYSLKTTEGIVGMKYDKSGGMAVIGAMLAAAKLGLKTPVVGVIAAAENMISAAAYRPDDILKALNGKTIEIISTDAEGRLVLADALTYTEQTFKPRAIIDIATLTGAVLIALGSVRAGLMSNHEELAAALLQAGERTHERLWRLPLDEDYFEQIRGDDADLKNSGGRKAGTIIGGMFLKQFVSPETPWAHIDIAGVMWAEKDLSYCPKGGMGFGVRLFLEYLESLN
ncbi:MAG: leucyl aminopeptidase [Anaerolineales bacterium]|nr:leucyl aminopeptidase [Anaerolineales bacterium]MCX7755460.1 leucyl aminopeptidase [Anaerolineales bacterium]MDW8278883.1 leucyl aminopeptidase [Anaerolineales bacterium]